MRIAKFWARVTSSVLSPAGGTVPLTFWGASATDQADAERDARARIARFEQLSKHGATPREYEYSLGTIREELVDEVRDAEGAPLGAITRNHYGALVLNSAHVFIADVDAPDPGALARLFAFVAKPKDKAWHRARIAALQAAHPETTYVVYETHSGLRVFRVDRDIEPASAAAKDELERLGSDPLYRKLCAGQQCYRARLTPKPWRCGVEDPPRGYPREGEHRERAFRDWLAGYEAKARGYAVCGPRTVIGTARMTAAAERLLAVHDRMVLQAGKPLA